MISSGEVARSVFGAWLLAKFDRNGAELFDNTPEAFWRSFWAAGIALPAYALVIILQNQATQIAVGPVAAFLIHVISYVISWFAFPFVMFYIVRLFDRSDFYLRYIAAYNWSALLRVTLDLGTMALAVSGLLPETLSDILVRLTFIAILIYVGFIAHVALEVPGIAAVGIVLLDLAITVLLIGWKAQLLAGQAVIIG